MKTTILQATMEDLHEILRLQHYSFVSQAMELGVPSIPPMEETLEEKQNAFRDGTILKLVSDDSKIIGSVMGRVDNGTLHIGKLMVHPDYRGQGFGKRLLNEIQTLLPHTESRLFTPTRSLRNIRMYEADGFRGIMEERLSDSITLLHMKK